MPGTVKGLAGATLVSLVVATVFSVTLGGTGWLWFAWVVLGLATLGVITAEGR